jgi:hypothetical protein
MLMKFNRGGSPKKSLDIGLEKDSVPLIDLRLTVDIKRQWKEGGYNQYREKTIYLKRRRLVNIHSVAHLLNQSEISLTELFRYFNIIRTDDPDEYLMFQKTINKCSAWRLLWKASRSEEKIYSTVYLDKSGGWVARDKYAEDVFTVDIRPEMDTSHINSKDFIVRDSVKGVIIDDRVYPLLPGIKKLRSKNSSS